MSNAVIQQCLFLRFFFIHNPLTLIILTFLSNFETVSRDEN